MKKKSFYKYSIVSGYGSHLVSESRATTSKVYIREYQFY